MRRPFMKMLREQVEAALTAAAFAEEGEFELARTIFSQATALHPHGSSRR